MTDRDQIVFEQLEYEWQALIEGIRQERLEVLYMQVSAATSRMSSAVLEDEITEAERIEALAIHDQTDQDFLAAVEGLTEAQWTFRPATNRWSIQENAEHIVLSTSVLIANVEQSLSRPPDVDVVAEAATFEQMRLRVMDRSKRGFQAPEGMSPQGQWSVGETIERYRQVRAQARELLARPGEPLKSHVVAFGPGTLSWHHWLMMLSLHTRRHLAQIVEVKMTPASGGFPQ